MKNKNNMDSAIKTITDKIKELEVELRIYSDPDNFSQKVLDAIDVELTEHKKALSIILKQK